MAMITNNTIGYKTVGTILDHAMETLEKNMLERANKADRRASYCSLGMQVFSVLTTLKGTFTQDLQSPCDQAVEGLQYTMQKVKELIQCITTGTPQKSEEVARKISEINTTLYFLSPQVPVLTDVKPDFIAVGNQSTKATIVFKGRFPYGERVDCSSFTLNEKKFTPTAKSNQNQLSFEVDIPETVSKPHEFTYIPGSLKIFSSNGMVSWKKTKYSVRLGLMPSRPGKFEILYTDKTKETVDAPKWGETLKITTTSDKPISEVLFIDLMDKKIRMETTDNVQHQHIGEVLTDPPDPRIVPRTQIIIRNAAWINMLEVESKKDT